MNIYVPTPVCVYPPSCTFSCSVSPDVVMSELADVKADRDRLRQEISELRSQDQQKVSVMCDVCVRVCGVVPHR